jgi:hypothetical protein
MNKWRRFKLWLAWKCLGEPEEINREVEYVYAEIYPKHDAYEAKTKAILREAFLRISIWFAKNNRT